MQKTLHQRTWRGVAIKLKVFLPLLLILFLYPFQDSGKGGSYNVISKFASCTTRLACLHEVGHALDQDSGWVSQSPRFEKALQMYLMVELRKPVLEEVPASILELTYRGNGNMGVVKMEIYAYLFAWADGESLNMPAGLRQFYNWTLAGKLISKLRDDQSLYWLK